MQMQWELPAALRVAGARGKSLGTASPAHNKGLGTPRLFGYLVIAPGLNYFNYLDLSDSTVKNLGSGREETRCDCLSVGSVAAKGHWSQLRVCEGIQDGCQGSFPISPHRNV